MVEIFLIDEVVRKRRIFDENGVPEDITSPKIKARVEDYNKMIRDYKGQEMMGQMLIIVKPGEDFTYEDLILIKKKNGVAYPQPNKEFAIKKIENAAGFFASQKEIYL